MGFANERSTSKLLQLCLAYFTFYVITGLTVKYFLGSPANGLPGLKGFQFLVYSTLGSVPFVSLIALILKWYKIQSARLVNIFGINVPIELFYIIPSGICTGIIIPTTTIMYSLPISVMVAMIIMRGAVIIISRIVDAIQIKQGLLKKKVYLEENIAVVFAVLAIGTHVIYAGKGDFQFLASIVAMATLLSYIGAYSIRIYIMNYYKNTAGKGVKRDNKAFFAIEQFAAAGTIFVVGTLIFFSPSLFGWNITQITDIREAILEPSSFWYWAMLAGTAFGIVSFFSVFIFMFKGRTATFTGLVNRLTSLIAGTTSTLLFWHFFGGRFPSSKDWVSLAFILIAIVFLTSAEKKRAKELHLNTEAQKKNSEEKVNSQEALTSPSSS